MIITIKGADFSTSGLGLINTVAITKIFGYGIEHNIPNYVVRDATVEWQLTLNNEYEFGSYLIKMGGAIITPTIVDNVMTISIPRVTESISINVGTLGGNIRDWEPILFELEVGTTSDDTTGTMGNLVNNANRVRTTLPIDSDGYVRVTSTDSTLQMWYNLFDDNGTLVGTSQNTKLVSDTVINMKALGATKIWFIFKTDPNGKTPVTVEQQNSITISKLSIGDLTSLLTVDNLEFGSFSDDTGEKVDNPERIRTISKIPVPTNAKGIIYYGIPEGFDVWIKGYSSYDLVKPDVCNGIGSKISGAYWGTYDRNNHRLLWDRISQGTKPEYLDLVFYRSTAINRLAPELTPENVSKTIFNFCY